MGHCCTECNQEHDYDRPCPPKGSRLEIHTNSFWAFILSPSMHCSFCWPCGSTACSKFFWCFF
jgi:hypothetical protein